MKGSLAGNLNLANKPFVNQRSITRVAGVLWFLAVVLIIANAVLYWRNSSGFAEGRSELRRLSAARSLEIEQVERLKAEFEGVDLVSQNSHVEFLNEKIVERTFPWSRLFDDLVETMPPEAKLLSLAHRGQDPSARRDSRRRTGGDDERSMELEIQGQATSGDAVLVFLENLFAHAAFAEPDLINESKDGQLVLFNLRTRYRTDWRRELRAVPAVPAVAAEEPAPSTALDTRVAAGVDPVDRTDSAPASTSARSR